MKKGTRLDAYLAEKGLSDSREKAKREILAGWVKVDGETVREPARPVGENRDVAVERPGGVFASRGGEKLAHALEHFGIDVRGRVVADLGASTGGFTDCLLERGASLVYAIDVGYGQLDYRLRRDPRVVVRERTNVRHVGRAEFEQQPGFVTADLSFISIVKVAPVIRDVFGPVEGVVLVKPQFEAEKHEQKKGVVRKPDIHERILGRVIDGLLDAGWAIRGLCYSPLKGPAGNIEFLLYFSVGIPGSPETPMADIGQIINRVVREAHMNLDI
ncbi:MAG: TlyA family RNA methyltransferase [Spirochaetes bacterium]|nr:MAG: TlyA family RNA methyltransferase [Spirochaetota bacterium]